MTDDRTTHHEPRTTEEPPPIGRTWLRLYTAVLLNLAFLVLVFWAITRHFS